MHKYELQIQRFIQRYHYYQRLTEHALQTLSNKCDHVFEFNCAREITVHKFKDVHA